MRTLTAVINWNGGDQVRTAVAGLCDQSLEPTDVVVIDNASHDGSAEGLGPDVEVVANATNLGYAGAANQALDLARARGADAVCVANPDVVVDRGYLAAATHALARDPRRASVQGLLWRTEPDRHGGRVIDTTGHLAFTTRLFRNRGEGLVDRGGHVPGEVFGTSGALALYRVAALDDVAVEGEVWDRDLFAFWEDVDLDWRLRLRGWSAWFEPAATAFHERGGAGPRRTARVEELNFANRFLVLWKNDTPQALARHAPGVVATSVLKYGELAVTVPSAAVRCLGRGALVPRMLAKRRVIQAAATVAPAAVVDRWFGSFDYGGWVRTWWRRVRA